MGKKGKSLKLSDLKKSMGVAKQSAKDSRKAAVRGAKRGRVGGDKELARASDVVGESKLIHPKSRKAKQVLRGLQTEKKKAEFQRFKDQRENAKAVKLLWFQERLAARQAEAEAAGRRLTCMTADALQEEVATYIKRNDDELSDLREKRLGLKHRVVRPTGREKELSNMREEEAGHAKSGIFEAPDLTTNKGQKALLAWDAEEDTFFNLVLKQVACKEELLVMPTAEAKEASYERIQELKTQLKEYKSKRVSKRSTTNVDAEKKQRAAVQSAGLQRKRAARMAKLRGADADADDDAAASPPPQMSEQEEARMQRKQQLEERRKKAAAASAFSFDGAGEGANPFGAPQANPFL